MVGLGARNEQLEALESVYISLALEFDDLTLHVNRAKLFAIDLSIANKISFGEQKGEYTQDQAGSGIFSLPAALKFHFAGIAHRDNASERANVLHEDYIDFLFTVGKAISVETIERLHETDPLWMREDQHIFFCTVNNAWRRIRFAFTEYERRHFRFFARLLQETYDYVTNRPCRKTRSLSTVANSRRRSKPSFALPFCGRCYRTLPVDGSNGQAPQFYCVNHRHASRLGSDKERAASKRSEQQFLRLVQKSSLVKDELWRFLDCALWDELNSDPEYWPAWRKRFLSIVAKDYPQTYHELDTVLRELKSAPCFKNFVEAISNHLSDGELLKYMYPEPNSFRMMQHVILSPWFKRAESFFVARENQGHARKIDDRVLQEMLESGRSSKFCAEFFHVSTTAINKKIKKLGLKRAG